MSTIDEKRVFEGGRRDTLYLATGLGVATVAVSDDLVGEFGLERRGDARDVAAAGDALAAATDGDVRVGPGFDPTGFGPAVAVGIHDGAVLAAAADGTVARYRPDARDGGDSDSGSGSESRDGAGSWQALGEAADPRRFDGPLLAAESGVSRIGDGLTGLGLADATPRDVCAVAPGFAATDAGLYRRSESGWTREREGPHRIVAGRDGRVHAVTDAGDLFARREGGGDGDWEPHSLPTAEPVADLAYAAAAVYALTEAGTVLADAGDGWRSRATGLRPVRAAAVGPGGADAEGAARE